MAPKDIIEKWMHIINTQTQSESVTNGNGETNGKGTKEDLRIGIHCLAGLGRAPFLVDIAMINKGCSPTNAIDFIRKSRPGALNNAQVTYILEYKPMKNKKNKGSNEGCHCHIF